MLETPTLSEAVGAKRKRIWGAWWLREVEVVGEIHRVSVAVRELPQAPIFFDEAKDAREPAAVMIDHPGPCIGGDDEERDADPEPEAVHLWRGLVIVEAAVVVPGDEEGRVLPH